MGKKIKKVLITTGLVTLMALSMTGCSQAAPSKSVETSAPVTTEADLDIQVNVPTTAIDVGDETVVAKVLETYEDEGFTGELDNGDPIVSMGKYGEYGKEMYDLLVDDWVAWRYETEEELRLNATAMLGSISEENYEAIIEEILGMDRGERPSESLSETPTPTQPAPQVESKPAPQKSVPQKQQTQSVETQASVQPTQPAVQEPAPTQPAVQEPAPTQPAPTQVQEQRDPDLAPGALSIEEIQRRKAEAGDNFSSNGEVEILDGSGWSSTGGGVNFK